MTSPKWLGRAADESGRHAWTLGAVLKQYQELEQKTAEDVARELRCSIETLNWLSLCREPTPERFASHVSAIAKRFGLDAALLAAILRRVQVVATLRDGSPRDDSEESELLLAARDRKPESEGEE